MTTIYQQLQTGDYDPVEAFEKAWERITRHEKTVNAFITIDDYNKLRVKAEEASKRIRSGEAGLLEGVLVAVKDNISTSWLPTTAGSRMLSCYQPPYNAYVVERLLEAGAIIVGKTNMDEFAMGSTGEFSAFGPTRNPWDLERVPGGSSSGSGAALAYRAVDLALGSDTGGSIRLPGAYTATVGLKPTYGAVSRRGLIPYANSLEQIGPMARSVIDTALLYKVISGYDPLDATSIKGPGIELERLQPADPSKLKICVIKEVLEASQKQVVAAFTRVIEKLEANGADVNYVSLKSQRYVLPTYYIIAMAEAASNLARYDGGIYNCGSLKMPTWEEQNIRVRSMLFGREVKRRIAMGVFVLSEGYRDEYYVLATRVRRMVRDEVLGLTRDCIIASPTSPVPPPKLGERISDPLSLYALDLATVTANLAGVPALQLPIATTSEGPVGIQLMARPWGEEDLFNTGLLIEEITGLRGVYAL
ncbi:MAG: Asp-tRNA(Asn)/Glu-tRNA(Gln) amidotransferase subunit GatA [Desulfurococcales archaeon]|nr:Asp-tRNA(Asn)/Glu-tRNA(Gln) amidotransferase subunit GatA [Desulfurococcales archaeon]